MTKQVVGVLVVMLLIGLMTVGVGAQTFSLNADEWMSLSKISTDWEEATAGMNLTTLSAELNVTKLVDFTAAYSFGESDEFKSGGKEVWYSDTDLTTLRLGGSYLLIPFVRANGGYLRTTLNSDWGLGSGPNESTTISGLYMGGTAEVPWGRGLTLRGEVLYSPLLAAKVAGADTDASLLSLDIGGKYHYSSMQITGGYRFQRYALQPQDEDLNFEFSGLYLGASYRF